MKNIIFTIGRFLKTLYLRFFEDNCTYRAAALTYTSLLSLVPLMAVSFAVFAAFPVFKNVSDQIQSFIFSHFVATSGELIQQYLQRFVAQTRNLSAIGSFFLVVTAVLMMFTMERAFNAIWRVKSRSFSISTFLLYWAVLTLSPILIGLSLVISNYVGGLPIISTTAQRLDLITILPFLLYLTFFTLIYILIPNCYVPIRHGFIGALVATILFTLAKSGFIYYVTHFPTYVLLYGALASIPIFLLWLYIMWVIILFGAIVSHVLATGYRFRSTIKIDGFTHGFCWLGYFWQALKAGKQLSLRDLLRLDSCGYVVEPTKQIEGLQKAGFIQPGSSGKYILTQDLTRLTIHDLLSKLPWRLPTKAEVQQWQGPWQQALQDVVSESEQALQKPLALSLAKIYAQEQNR